MSKPIANKTYLRIGQIAERTGVSSKALRLYERRGLLKPCAHSEGGYRLYGPVALRRLMQIVVLKRSGFTLAQVADLLSSQTHVVTAMLDDRIGALQSEIIERTNTLGTLRTLSERLACASTLDLDQLLENITMSDNLNLNVNQTQREKIRERAEKFRASLPAEKQALLLERVDAKMDELGDAGIEALQRPWRELSLQIRNAMAVELSVDDPRVAELAQRWRAFVLNIAADDPVAILAKLRDMYTRHPELMDEQSMSPAMIDYMSQAMARAGLRFDS